MSFLFKCDLDLERLNLTLRHMAMAFSIEGNLSFLAPTEQKLSNQWLKICLKLL